MLSWTSLCGNLVMFQTQCVTLKQSVCWHWLDTWMDGVLYIYICISYERSKVCCVCTRNPPKVPHSLSSARYIHECIVYIILNWVFRPLIFRHHEKCAHTNIHLLDSLILQMTYYYLLLPFSKFGFYFRFLWYYQFDSYWGNHTTSQSIRYVNSI